jgi:hypothetical protein
MQSQFLVQQLQNEYPDVWNKMLAAKTPEEASTIMLTEFERPANTNSHISRRANYAKQYYNQFAGTAVGGPKTTINPRIIKRDVLKNISGPSMSIDSTIDTSYTRDYTTAANASRYMNNSNNFNMSRAVNVIISLLEAITGNTADASNKLKLLENLKGSNVNIGGNTNNYVTNSSSPTSASSSNNVNSSINKVSRNQIMAEKIAAGI